MMFLDIPAAEGVFRLRQKILYVMAFNMYHSLLTVKDIHPSDPSQANSSFPSSGIVPACFHPLPWRGGAARRRGGAFHSPPSGGVPVRAGWSCKNAITLSILCNTSVTPI